MPAVTLAPTDSMSMVVLKFLLEGKLRIRMTVQGYESHGEVEGYVHTLDFAAGNDHAFASVWFELLRLGQDTESVTVKVALKTDGTVEFLEVL